MRFLSPTIHGIVDYLAALALIAGPFVVFPANAPLIATVLSAGAGVALIIYSLITDYSVSARRAIPFKLHLAIDFTAGAAFVAAPFVLGFTGILATYFWVMGAAVILVVLVTNPETEAIGEPA